jgi:hypothetical protein
MRKESLRRWAAPSYDSRTGRSASSLDDFGGRGFTNYARGDDQISASHGAGRNGAPGLPAGATQGYSGDPHRVRKVRI